MNTWISKSFRLALLIFLATTGTAVAQDVAVVDSQTIGGEELASRIEAEAAPVILDVRSPEEFAEEHIPGAINIPYTELEDRYEELGIEASDEIVVYCRTGRRAGIAEAELAELGFTNLRDLEGHIEAWKKAERPLE